MVKQLSLRILIIFFSILNYYETNAQFPFYNRDKLDAKIILYNSTDTVEVKVIVRRTMEGALDELSFYNVVKYEKDGKKDSYPEARIDYMEFIDYDKKRIYVTSRKTDIKNARGLWEVKYKGKLTWYREYYPTLFPLYYRLLHGTNYGTRDFFVREGEMPVNAKQRKITLLQLTSDRPDLVSRIRAIKTEHDALQIFRLYDI